MDETVTSSPPIKQRDAGVFESPTIRLNRRDIEPREQGKSIVPDTAIAG